MFKEKPIKLLETHEEIVLNNKVYNKLVDEESGEHVEKFIDKTINVLGKEMTIFDVHNFITIYSVRGNLRIKHEDGSLETFEDIVIRIIKPEFINPEWVKLANESIIKKREDDKKKVNEKYEMLCTVCKDYRQDMKTLSELEGLLYCEADTFMDKMITRIENKGSAKALKQYKLMMEYLKQDVIECEM